LLESDSGIRVYCLFGFPRAIPERRYSMLRLCHRWRFFGFWDRRIGVAWTPTGHDVEAGALARHFGFSGVHTCLDISLGVVVA